MAIVKVSMANDYQQSSVRSAPLDNPRIYPEEESRKRRRDNFVRISPFIQGNFCGVKPVCSLVFPRIKPGILRRKLLTEFYCNTVSNLQPSRMIESLNH
jgi:hypothetical protein